jgi:metal transporter CNNM
MAGAIARARPVTSNGLLKARPLTLGIAKLLCTSLWSAVSAAPVSIFGGHHDDHDPEGEDTARWVLYVASAVLVLLGGAFAGLTIAYGAPVYIVLYPEMNRN